MKPVLTAKQRRVWTKLLNWLDMTAKERKKLGLLAFNMNEWLKLKKNISVERDAAFSAGRRGPRTYLPLKECGTVCCIGGFAILNSAPKSALIVDKDGCWYDYESDSIAAHALGMDYETSQLLFYPRVIHQYEWKHIRGSQAAKVVRHYLATGIIDWTKAKVREPKSGYTVEL